MTTTGIRAGSTQLIAIAEEIGDVAGSRLARSDSDRRVPDEVKEALIASKLLWALLPRRVGGFGLDPSAYVAITRAISKRAPSLGWLYGIVSIHKWYRPFADIRFQHEVRGSSDETLVVDSFALNGTAEPPAGGYLLSGRRKFASAPRPRCYDTASSDGKHL